MVLPLEDLGEEFAGFTEYEDSGFKSNEDVAAEDDEFEGECGPDATVESLEEEGHRGAYELGFEDETAYESVQGTYLVETYVDLYGTADQQAASVDKGLEEARELDGSVCDDLTWSIETFEVDGLGDEADGLRFGATGSEVSVFGTAIGFTLGRLSGAARLYRFDDEDVSDQARELAALLEDRMVAVLVGAELAETDNSDDIPGEFHPSEGREHSALDVEYATNPPTSGAHSSVALPGGVYYDPVQASEERAVQNMEQGWVVIWFNCEAGELSEEECADMLDDLRDRYGHLLTGHVGGGLLIIKNATMEHLLAVTSWTRLLELDELEEGAIDEFIEVNRCRYDPEGLCT